jgi:hypothetical protein
MHMKATICLVLIGFALTGYAQNQTSSAPPIPLSLANSPPVEISPYAITQRGPHQRLWQKVTAQTNIVGQTIYQTNSYSELATGICYWNSNQWIDSSDQIQLTGNGAAATNTQHRVAFAANINDSGAVSLTTPDGQQMTSHILGLVYVDASTGANVLFAETQDSLGGLLASGNQIIYTNAFTNANCDVLYTHRLSGLEQDIIIRKQLPLPASYGLTGSNIWLQVWTEFPTAPAPQATQMQNSDNFLDFGVMKMGRGKAFMLGNSLTGVPVVKSWVTSQGRTFLIESVRLNSIGSQLAQLPALSPSSGSSNSLPGSGSSGPGDQSGIRHSRSALASLAPPRPDFKNLRLPPLKVAKKSPATMYLAASTLAQNGLVVDYNIENGSLTDFTFQGDTTYYITNIVDLYGSCVIEGGTVIKFSTNTSASIISGYGTNLTFKTGPYRPAIFTAQDDNSVGDQISGSTGSPTNYYGGVGIQSTYHPAGAVTWKNMRFSYLRQALDLENNAFYLYDTQFNNCQQGVYLNTESLLLCNALFCNVATDFYCVPDPANIELDNVTIHNSSLLCDMEGYETYSYTGDPGNWPNFTGYFVNCLLVDVTNTGPPIGVYSYTTTNATVILTNDTGVFQTVGAGSHYLATNTYRGLGTTNVDSAELLAELRQKTTWPPLVMSNVVISNNTTLGPYASRDTNISTLDLGYHYDPLDYIMDTCTVTNATLTFTNGVGIGYFSDTVGTRFNDGSALVSVGTPLAPNWFTSYQMVQEQCVTIGSGSSAYYLYPYHYGSTGPNGLIQFSKFSGGSGSLLYDTDPWAFNNLLVQNCEFWNGGGTFSGSTNSGTTTVLDNNLFARSVPEIDVSAGASFAFSNNLVWCAQFDFKNSSSGTCYAFNNDFDTCSFITLGSSSISNGYNAYLNCGTNRLSPTNAYDIVSGSSLTYQTGPLGYFYQPTNSLLIDKGSTNANVLGLYHYTTQTNQTEEADSTVDIGYHYVALSSSGSPIDANSNGVPDYLENPYGPAPPYIIVQPANQFVELGSNVTFFVVAAGAGPLSYQWSFNGTNLSSASSSIFTTNDVQSGSAGNYAVTVTNAGGSTASSNAVLTVVSCDPVPSGIVSWWPAEGSTNDFVGTNNGVLAGTAGYTNGYVGQAFNFLATGDGVSTPTGGFPTGTNNRTMECWVYINSFISGAESFFAGYGHFGTTGATYELGAATDHHSFFSQWGASIEGPVLTTNQWYHIAVTSVGTNTITLYLDGTNVASGSLAFNTPAGTTNFIAEVTAPSATRQTIGRIDELSIYNRALSSNEIEAIYSAGSVGKCSHPPVIIVQPATQTAPVGNNVTFTVVASGDLPLGYQWEFNGTNISGATETDYTVNNVQLGDDGAYSVVVTNGAGSATSSNGVLTVLSPNSVSGLRLWLNASVGVTNDSSGLVSGWADQSGNSNYASQSSGSHQPTIVSNAIDGNPVIQFNGSNAYLNLPDVLPSTAATQGEAFAVVKVTQDPATGDHQALWSFGSANGNESYPDSKEGIRDSFGSQLQQWLGMPVQPLTNYHIYDVSTVTNDWAARVNAVLIYETNNNPVGFRSDPKLGYNGNGYFAGELAEILVYNHVLTPTDRDTVGYYFNARYGLVQAPAAPAGLTALELSSNQVSLVWNAVLTSTNLNFKVERSAGNTNSYAQVALVRQGASYIDTGLTPGVTYYYRVKASNYGGDSAYSNTTNATPVAGQAAFPLSNLLIWFKGDAGNAGSNICFWADQSGNNNHATELYNGGSSPAIYPWCPSVLTNSINGRPVIHFNGINSLLNLQLNALQELTAGEALAVVRAISNGDNLQLWAFGGVNGTLYPNTSGAVEDDFGSIASQSVGYPLLSAYVPNVYDVYSAAGDWAARFNGIVQVETNQTEVVFPAQPTIGGGINNDSANFNGDIAEILIFNRVLAETERNAVGVYLSGKYGITNAPPASPTNVLATGISPTQISLGASGPLSNVCSLILERKLGAGGTYSQIGILSNPAENVFVDTITSTTNQYYYRITAYNYAGPSTPAVIAPPTALITSPVASTPLSLGTNITITSIAADPDGSIAKVDLYNSSTLLGTQSNSPYNFNISTTNAVYFGLTTKATDNQGNTRISFLVNLPVYTNTSSDGRNDGWDIMLGLDPTNTNNVPFNPTDTNAPLIFLLQPTNATPVP